MPPEAAATVTPDAAPTPQAAPPPHPPSGAADGAPPPAANGDGSASAAEAKAAEQAGETPEQRQKRVEAAGKRARREAARNRELQAQIARQNAELQRAQGAQRELERIEALRKDKWAAARELGIDPRELAEQALKEGTPEYQAEQRIKAAEERAANAERIVQEWRQQQEQRTRAEQQQQHRGLFVKASGDAALYPDVAKLPEPVRVAYGLEIVREQQALCEQRGIDWKAYAPTLTDAVILKEMQKRLAGVPTAPAKAPETESTPDAKGNGSASPQTVTSKVASQKFAPPANWDELSDEQQKRIIAQQLEQGATRKK